MVSQKPLSRKALLGYAFLAPSLAFAELPLYLHIPKYYHMAFGLNLSIIGIILLGVRSIDALKDPFLGIGVDRLLEAKFSYKQIIAYSLIPFILSYYFLFNPSLSVGIALSLTLALLLVHFFDSLLTIAYLSLGAVITNQYHDRTRITAYREGIKVIGVILASVLPALKFQGQNDSQTLIESFSFATYVLVALVVVGGCSFYKWSPQPQNTPRLPRNSVSLKAVFNRAIQYISFRRLVGIYGFNAIASAIPATLIFFFIDHVLKATSYTVVFLSIYFIAAVLGMGIWTKLAKVRSKRFSWLVGMGVSIIVFSFAFMLGKGDLISYGFICFFSGLCLGADVAIPPAIFADVIDQVDPDKKWHAGFFGVWSVTTKLAIALAAGISLTLLDYGGFSEAPESGTSLIMLSVVYALIPCFFKIIAFTLLYRSSIDLEKRP